MNHTKFRIFEQSNRYILGWTEKIWNTAQNFPNGRGYRSESVQFQSRLHLQKQVFLIRIPVAKTPYSILCPIEWNESDDQNFNQIMANIISLHHLARTIHGKTVNQIRQALIERILQRLRAITTSGERSWTAPILETSRHMTKWNTLVVAATQTTPTLPNGQLLKWLRNGFLGILKLALNAHI